MPTKNPPSARISPTYAYVARPFGGELRLTLCDGALELNDSRRVVKIPLADITAVRLTYEPRNTLSRGYRTRLTIAGRRSVSFSSISWVSLVQTENRGAVYRAFLAALMPAIARANPSCRFRAGRPPLVWGLLVLCSIALIAGCVGVLWRSGSQATTGMTLAIAAFTAAFAWVAFDLVKRNRPREFDPAAPPADLMP